MGVGRGSAIGATLAFLGIAAVVAVGMWVVTERERQIATEPDLGTMAESERPLGPHDGFDLPAVDTGRVAVGDIAPDFSLMSYAGTVTTLSDFRGEKNVVLQFYRGYW
jgi:hypothetical protein